jgi:hypothetical protein
MQTFYFKNTNTGKVATSIQKDDQLYPQTEWEEIDENEYAEIMVDERPPAKPELKPAATATAMAKIGFVMAFIALFIAIAASVVGFLGLYQPKYDDTILSEKVAAVETQAGKNTTAIADANKTIADSAAAATEAIAKLRGDVSNEFVANRRAQSKLAKRLDTAESSVTKLTEKLADKVSWVSLKKVSNAAAAERAALSERIVDNKSAFAGMHKLSTNNATRLTAVETELTVQKEAIIEVANRAAAFANSAKVTRSWFLGKPRLEAEKGIFDAPIFTEL